MIQSRFATKEEIFCDEFNAINGHLIEINKKFNLSDHSEINEQRFPWSKGLFDKPSVYVSRMWEYPFAILSAELQRGMKCADVGCGTSPFTIYLAEVTGKDCVTGFDPDEIKGSNFHSTFGANSALLNSIGIHYKCNNMTMLDAADESYDRVFCIGVLEHVKEPAVWQKCIREMVRILKPGGRLIITMDIGIELPLTNPLDIIKYSGLTICGSFNYLWTKERFLKMGNSASDVFGLILEKNNQNIFADYEKQKQIPQSFANRNFVPPITDSKQIQIGNDLRRSNGALRVITKLILGKYKR